jgi:hypothetical protein
MSLLRRTFAVLALTLLLGAPPVLAKPRPTPPPKPSAVPPLPMDGRFVYMEATDWDAVMGQVYIVLPATSTEDGHVHFWFVLFHVSLPGGPHMDRRLDGLAAYHDVDCATNKGPPVPGAFRFGPKGERGLVIEPWGEPREIPAASVLGRSIALACDRGNAVDGGLPGFDAAWDDALARDTKAPPT